MLKIRTALLYTLIIAYTIFPGIFVIVIGRMLPFKYRGPFILQSWIRAILWIVRNVGGIKHKITGLEKLDAAQKVVIISKHQSMYETLLYQDMLYPVLHIAKQSLKHVPLFGWGLTMIGTIYIDRNNKISAQQQILERGRERIEQGYRLVIYPEGTRVAVGDYLPYKTGGARAAMDFDASLFPIVHNAGEYWDKSGLLQTGCVEFVVGDPIAFNDRTAREITDEAEAWMKQQYAKITTVS